MFHLNVYLKMATTKIPENVTAIFWIIIDFTDLSCNDSAHFLGTTAVVRCIILDTFFTSLNITFLSEHSQNEEYVGEIFPDGQTQSIPQSPIILSTNFDLSPKILMFTFQQLKCSSKGRYRIIAGGTNSSVAASVETFDLNVLGMLNPMNAKNECIVGV